MKKLLSALNWEQLDKLLTQKVKPVTNGNNMNIFESEEGVNVMDLEDNEEFIQWLDSLNDEWLIQEPPELDFDEPDIPPFPIGM